MADTHLHSYTITKIPKRQRSLMLSAVDAGGRLPAGLAPARVLESIPEAWARSDEATGTRSLTPEGRAALITVDRYRALRRANPETGSAHGLTYSDGRGLHRDGLVIYQSGDGRIAEPTSSWKTGASPYITERGRKLIGMPSTAPPFAVRHPLRSRAVWRRQGQPDEIVQINTWPFTDGMVTVSRIGALTMHGWHRSWDVHVPTTELFPQ
jgi:hypothetical protein